MLPAIFAISWGLAIGCSSGDGTGLQPEGTPVPGTQTEALRALRPEEIVGTLAIGGAAAGVAYSNPPLYRRS